MLEAAPFCEGAIGEASLIEGLVTNHRYGEKPPIFAEPHSVGKDGGKPIVSMSSTCENMPARISVRSDSHFLFNREKLK